jgi:cytochrome b6-f complex iron-sulfur subunit
MRSFVAALCLVASAAAFRTAPTVASRAGRVNVATSRPMVMAEAGGFVPDMQRRTIMNLLLAGAVGVPGLSMVGGYALFFLPPSSGGGGGTVAKTKLGDDISISAWKGSHAAGERQLVQGLKGDAYWLVLDDKKEFRPYAINGVCTHLGCIAPWNAAQNKYMCPCHGSQYDTTGMVIRGPAPLSLALAILEEQGDKIILTNWAETDFRTGLKPWWN